MKALKGLAATAFTLTTAGCLQLPDARTASSGYTPEAPPYAYYSPPAYNQPPHYLPPVYQPPPLSPNLTPETAPPPAVGSSTGRDQVRYLPAPQPPQSLLGPQRPGWN